MTFHNILIGTKTILSWKHCIQHLQHPNLFIINFNDSAILEETLLKNNIDYILPLSERDYNTIQYIPIKILYPKPETYNLLDNKILFIQFMLKYFRHYIPEIYYLDRVKLKALSFPVISKPIWSKGGSNMNIYHTERDFATCTSKHIVQQFIKDLYEYSAYILCIDSEIKTWKIIRYKYPEYTIKKDNFPANYENVPEFDITIFRKIIKKLDYTGSMCIDFKLDKKNRIKILEINPRFGGSAFTNNFIHELLQIKKEEVNDNLIYVEHTTFDR